MQLIDSHAHVGFRQFDEDREAVVERARAAGVRWVEIGTDIAHSRKAIAVARQYENDCLGATVGVHPSDVSNMDAEDWKAAEKLIEHTEVIAVGEVGLDFYRVSAGLDTTGRDSVLQQQLEVLDRFIQLALRKNLPVVFHVRSGEHFDAHRELITYLSGLAKVPCGIIHTYSGTQDQAEQYLELGLCLSFSGVVTFKNAGEVADIAARVPLERMLVETDCPFLAPDPYRGKRNEPAHVVHVAERISSLRDVSYDDVVAASHQNTLKVFGRSL